MKKWMVPWLVLLPLIVELSVTSCQRENPAEKTQSPQPASTVDRAAQQAVEAIKMPMDKARGVEGTLGEAAERTADRVKETGQ